MEEKQQPMIANDMQMLIAGIMPNTRYFDSRFDLLQVQIDGLKNNQSDIKERLNQFEKSVDKRFEQVDKRFEQVDKRFEQVDKRFEQVDKRFEQIIASIDKLSDKLDHRDDNQRGFTLRMFTIAISISIIGVFGVFLKAFGLI